MIQRFCDWCGELISPADLMPRGGGAPFHRLGMEVRSAPATDDQAEDSRVISIVVGPVSVDGLSNAHDFHKACVQSIVAQGEVQ